MVAFELSLLFVLRWAGAAPPSLATVVVTVTALVSCILAWAYYAVTTEALTTIAHGCAAVMGCLLGAGFAVAYVKMHDASTGVAAASGGATGYGHSVSTDDGSVDCEGLLASQGRGSSGGSANPQPLVSPCRTLPRRKGS